MKDKGKIRILTILVDNSTEVRKRLRSMLELHQDIEIIAEAENIGLLNDTIKESAVGAIIIDLNFSEINGIIAIKRIKKFWPEVSIIVLSLQEDLRYLQACIRAGASGYVLLDDAFDELPYAIRNVVKGNLYISNKLNP